MASKPGQSTKAQESRASSGEPEKGKKPESPKTKPDSPKGSGVPATGSQGPAEQPIEAETPGADTEEDEFLEAGWDAGSSLASTSVSSSVYQHAFENGRRYHSYKYGRYPIPNDDVEQNREDMKHAMMLELTDGELYISPIGSNPQKILDIGTGTGIWAIEMADKFPSASVLGIDLSAIQPKWVPPNLRFIIDDIEEDVWANGSNWDFIHLRSMAVILRDLPKVLNHCFEHLKPGGWIEFQEVFGQPRSDDGTMPADDVVVAYYETSLRAMVMFGMDVEIGPRLRGPLEAAGFVNIRPVMKKIPLGPWARDRTLRVVGEYSRIILEQSASAMFGKPFEKLGYSVEEREVWGAKLRQCARDTSRHRYFQYWFWAAQKPE